ncbi:MULTISPECIES: D-alanyl-D-alanine carboxypeptidase family protein [Bacillus cereus group]|uniref:D-alanyl-D-alanine carboxypeptidase family protein n=1 Tax=Bacillus cereus group TaxID=86661 RepID=UPI0022E93193|nr:D-alanyl-D-alanine carboxypeptidase family protein [Bacillus cereus group sp. TH152-1LC]MDA1674948.1 D-alanyl-D-alanine carboxypeptidase [Bacillus cereus group sp. TH152-1LC]
MNTVKKINIIVMLSMFMSLFISNSASAESVEPNIIGNHGVSLDAQSGDVLFDKTSHQKAYPASVTKVMTALMLDENIKENETITLSKTCVNEVRSNSQIAFKEGEKLSRDTALFTMMTISANDIACAIGEHIAGSQEAFGAMMTKRAEELGALDTQFKNANGLHDPEHYTTAYDMALIGREAIKHDLVRKAMATKHYKVTTDLQKDVPIVNKSKIHDDPDSIGGKTGFTNEARNTLMKIDEKDGIRVVNVIFGANKLTDKYNIYDDILKISKYSMDQLTKKLVVDEEKWNKKLTFLEKKVIVKPEKSLYLTMQKNDNSAYDVRFTPKKIDEDLLYIKGISKGQKLGEIEIIKNDKKIDTVNVVSTQNVVFEKPKDILIPFWIKVLAAIIIPLGSYIGFVFLYNYRYFNNKKRPV